VRRAVPDADAAADDRSGPVLGDVRSGSLMEAGTCVPAGVTALTSVDGLAAGV
jgi:hypothetical protein